MDHYSKFLKISTIIEIITCDPDKIMAQYANWKRDLSQKEMNVSSTLTWATNFLTLSMLIWKRKVT
jgi:hypothetical protein